jgi:hypothetical protein
MVNSAATPETQRCSIDTDYHSWLVEQAGLIRSRQYDRIDWDNVAEELGDMAASLRRSLKSDLEILLQHLLKLQFESSQNGWQQDSRGWKLSVLEHRHRMVYILEDAPGLRRFLPEFLTRTYPHAVPQASIATGLPESKFPKECPWSIPEIMEMDFPDLFSLGRG